MFGYVTINKDALSQEEYDRFRAHYCGLCHVLCARYGQIGRATLSYDMTFLSILLSSLYEPTEISGEERCATHPAKPHAYVVSDAAEYAADMNIILAYHVALDHLHDDKSPAAYAQVRMLKNPYARVKTLYPEKCAAIESCIAQISFMEKHPDCGIDGPANETGKILGLIYARYDDMWAPTLKLLGEALGRFIYVMDAYDDLAADIKKNRFNPLIAWQTHDNFEEFCHQILTMHIAECAAEFERLPLINDAQILKCVIYSGVWSRYAYLQKRKEENK